MLLRQQFCCCPHVIRDPRFHRRRHAQRAMDTDEVVPSEVEAERGPVVLPLLAEAVGEARESANLHPHGEVLTLNVRRANAG